MVKIAEPAVASVAVREGTGTSLSEPLVLRSRDWLPRLCSRSVLRLQSGSIQLIAIRLVDGALLSKLRRIYVPELLLVALLAELGHGAIEIVRTKVGVIELAAVGGVEIIAIEVVRINIVIVAIVIVVSIDESVRPGNIGIVVVEHSRVVPATSPGIPTPSATSTTVDSSANGDAHSE